jgi:hypothetical protein
MRFFSCGFYEVNLRVNPEKKHCGSGQRDYMRTAHVPFHSSTTFIHTKFSPLTSIHPKKLNEQENWTGWELREKLLKRYG